MSVTTRLAELGLELPAVATPVGAYVPALRQGAQVTTSGQLPLVAGKLPATGKVGAEVSPEQAYDLARTAALNALAAASSVAGGPDAITGVLRVCVFVASDPGFTAQAGVANGASDLLGELFGVAGQHVRSAVGVAVLPLDAPVEVELTVTVS
ncbi:Enamine deaminase RidA, house cleaning of reactive enamine intermediates, YjgF/YER057c/UK114 family [Raineyella antarctica]|uniref:Enamine deaminase RidA, house cleaning of reactive enamine intermediates, YjgF/YER057c/UK114 family n=1 Tax=Raineyella antarctica TaxID=1577474 RepID=A0A1G6GFH5_9ACTN|nr:RidA family protein [Raineyella antarctica]SDB80758.1 Enamine deaminase RidA, house cleaning of reactive enamine intermediates, YjgF/YER057c/UK114 family [Raineyella antarctica]